MASSNLSFEEYLELIKPNSKDKLHEYLLPLNFSHILTSDSDSIIKKKEGEININILVQDEDRQSKAHAMFHKAFETLSTDEKTSQTDVTRLLKKYLKTYLFHCKEIIEALRLEKSGEIEKSRKILHKLTYQIESQLNPSKYNVNILYMFDCFARLLIAQNRHADAVKWLRKTLSGSRELFGEAHVFTHEARNKLGLSLLKVNQYDEAKELFEKSIAMDYLNHETLSGMAFLLKVSGQLDNAESYYRKALLKAKHKFGENHSSTLSVLQKLASVLKQQGKYLEAKEIYYGVKEIIYIIF